MVAPPYGLVMAAPSSSGLRHRCLALLSSREGGGWGASGGEQRGGAGWEDGRMQRRRGGVEVRWCGGCGCGSAAARARARRGRVWEKRIRQEGTSVGEEDVVLGRGEFFSLDGSGLGGM